MRLRLGWLTLMVGGAIVFGGASASPAHAQSPAGCALPETVDEAQAQAFQSELEDVWLSFQPDGTTVDPNQSLSNLLGFPGKYDLAPGELIATAITNDASGLPCPDPGDGSKLSGPCIGMAMSFDGDGKLLDIAADLSPDGAPIDIIESRNKGQVVRAFTKDNPFQVDVDGFVAYVGKAGENGDGPKNHHWSIKSFGAELDSGGDPNNEGKNRNAGAVNLKDDLPAPAKINAVFKIEGHMEADNGFVCDGAGYFETKGGLPIAGGVGVLAIAGAGLGALFNARPAKTWRGN